MTILSYLKTEIGRMDKTKWYNSMLSIRDSRERQKNRKWKNGKIYSMQIVTIREQRWLHWFIENRLQIKKGYKNKAGHYINKDSILQENITIINIYVPNYRLWKYMNWREKYPFLHNRLSYNNSWRLQYPTHNNG